MIERLRNLSPQLKFGIAASAIFALGLIAVDVAFVTGLLSRFTNPEFVELAKGVIVEMHGVLCDVVLALVIVTFIDEGRTASKERAQQIQEWSLELRELSGLESDESAKWTAGLVKRLSGLDVRIHAKGANLRGADLSLANLVWADFIDANLEGAQLNHASLSTAFFSRANLRDAIFVGADLRKAKFPKANLDGATFMLAKIQGARFTGASLVGTDFKSAFRHVDDEPIPGWIVVSAGDDGVGILERAPDSSQASPDENT